MASVAARPEAKSAVKWVRHGWPVIAGYLVGFGLILSIVGWHPRPLSREVAAPAAHGDAVAPAPR